LDQVPLFQPITKYQGHVNNPARMAEITGRAFDIAINERGPVQLNIPRDYYYGEANFSIPQPNYIENGAGGPQSLESAAALLASAKNPVILAGGGVATAASGTKATAALAEFLSAYVD
jgi:sulfoacetaldehyde acetyltransferase